MNTSNDRRLFWACWIALIATAFGFIIRALIIDDWQTQFGLSETQKGEIFGVGLWPFALSIILFSLVIDHIGYGRAMVFAFICHVASAIVTICAPLVLAKEGAGSEQVLAGQRAGYWMLYVGNFIVALGNGTVEAVINPVVATMFAKDKTKWLNVLHAGWPGGLVVGGLLTIALGSTGVIGANAAKPIGWEWKVALILIPTIIYGLMMLGCKFPVSERVAAGVPYRTMLQEVGIFGALIVCWLMTSEVGRVFDWPNWFRGNVVNFLVLCYGIYVLSYGRPMFIFLLLIMIPLATTELGTDSWISDLMKPVMKDLKWEPGWVLVYTSFIMMVLRFFAGPIVHRLSPLGLLTTCSLIAAGGLIALSRAEGTMIFAAATLYGVGKTFFWPTMLGTVSEQFPKGGALTLNVTGGVGMLGVGVVGAALLGNIQDKQVDHELEAKNPTVYSQVVGAEQSSVFGSYKALDQAKVDNLPDDQKQAIDGIKAAAKKDALAKVAIFPLVMFVCYVILIIYFRSKGGYQAQVLTGHAADDKEFTGGTAGPGEG